MAVDSRAYVVLQIEGEADPGEITAGQTFWSHGEAQAECERLEAEAKEGVQFCVKETFFFSGSAVR